jgi:adenylate cyclase
VGIRFKLTALLLALSLIPLGVATGVLLQINLQRFEADAREYRAAVADEGRKISVDYVLDALSKAREIGYTLARPEVPVKERIRIAGSLLGSAKMLDRAAIYSSDGKLVETITVRSDKTAPLPKVLDKLDPGLLAVVRNEKWVKLALGKAPSHLSLLTPMYQLGQKPAADGKLTAYGYLLISVSLRGLNELIAKTSARRFRGVDGRMYVVDQKLRVVVHASRTQRGKSIAGKYIAKDMASVKAAMKNDVAFSDHYQRDGRKVLGVLQSISELKWAIVVEQLHEEAYAGVRSTWQTALAVGAAFVLISLIVGLLMGARVTRPVVALAGAASQVADGNFEVQPVKAGKDEVGNLARAFGTMVQGLKEREFIRDTFGRYVSPEVVERALAEPESLKLGGQLQVVTVLISDLRGFTALANRLGPEAMVSVLNRYFTRMTDVIMRHDGLVSEFAGDSVVAFFGAPVSGRRDALRAVACAVDMQIELARFNDDEGHDFEMGIGVDTGQVIAGNIGSEQRMKYGVVGNTINMAARLEGMTLGCQVLISGATYSEVKADVEVGDTFEVMAKGRDEPVLACDVLKVRAGDGELAMPSADVETVAVSLAGRCYRLKGKTVSGEALACRVERVGRRQLTLLASFDIERLDHLKIEIDVDEKRRFKELYGRIRSVQARAGDKDNRLEIHLTAIPDEARAFFDELIASQAACEAKA